MNLKKNYIEKNQDLNYVFRKKKNTHKFSFAARNVHDQSEKNLICPRLYNLGFAKNCCNRKVSQFRGKLRFLEKFLLNIYSSQR